VNLDPHHLRRDMAMTTSALKKGWPVPEEQLPPLHKQALSIVVNVPDGRLRDAAVKLVEAIERTQHPLLSRMNSNGSV